MHGLFVLDLFYYQIRLPKGLQHKNIPEVQIEIPAYHHHHFMDNSKREEEGDQANTDTDRDIETTTGTGNNTVSSHKLFTFYANAEVEMGNRMKVKIPSIGTFKVQFPLNSVIGYVLAKT
jgi:hypothetical protein